MQGSELSAYWRKARSDGCCGARCAVAAALCPPNSLPRLGAACRLTPPARARGSHGAQEEASAARVVAVCAERLARLRRGEAPGQGRLGDGGAALRVGKALEQEQPGLLDWPQAGRRLGERSRPVRCWAGRAADRAAGGAACGRWRGSQRPPVHRSQPPQPNPHGLHVPQRRLCRPWGACRAASIGCERAGAKLPAAASRPSGHRASASAADGSPQLPRSSGPPSPVSASSAPAAPNQGRRRETSWRVQLG